MIRLSPSGLPVQACMQTAADEKFLENLLKKITSNEAVEKGDCIYLTTLFAPSSPSPIRAKALLALSSICDHYRRQSTQGSDGGDDSGTYEILHSFLTAVEIKLSDVEESPLLEVISFVAALFAVDWRAGSALFIRDGFQDSVMDALDMFPSSKYLPIVVAELLSFACGYNTCRTALIFRCSAWLESTFRRRDVDDKLKAAVSLSLLKCSQGIEGEGRETGSASSPNPISAERQTELFSSLRNVIASSNTRVQDVSDAVEGLAYLSTKSIFKNSIVEDTPLLQKLVSFRTSLQQKPQERFGTTPFGLASIIANVVAYPERLSEEQAQIERLKRMARPKASDPKQSSFSEQFDDDEHVRSRGKRLIAVGALDLLVSIARTTDSAATKIVVGRAFLGLVEDKDNRGKILQAGGARTLMALIRASQHFPDAESSRLPTKTNIVFSDLPSIQALAKLAITASPMQVFGPNENVSVEAIKPLVCLLLHASSTLLQRFEAMMALTNISSNSSELAERTARAEGLLGKVEFYLLEEHLLVRRAATELICNLVSGSEYAFNRFSGEGSSGSSGSLNKSKTLLHILTALADVEDEQTRLAASGALAVLTGSPTACHLALVLELEHHRILLVFKQLIDPTSDQENQDGEACITPHYGLIHRGVVCVRNVFLNLPDDTLRSRLANEAVNRGLLDALVKVMKSAGQSDGLKAVLQPTAEALKWLMDSGVNISANK